MVDANKIKELRTEQITEKLQIYTKKLTIFPDDMDCIHRIRALADELYKRVGGANVAGVLKVVEQSKVLEDHMKQRDRLR